MLSFSRGHHPPCLRPCLQDIQHAQETTLKRPPCGHNAPNPGQHGNLYLQQGCCCGEPTRAVEKAPKQPTDRRLVYSAIASNIHLPTCSPPFAAMMKHACNRIFECLPADRTTPWYEQHCSCTTVDERTAHVTITKLLQATTKKCHCLPIPLATVPRTGSITSIFLANFAPTP